MTWLSYALTFMGGGTFGFILAAVLASSKIAEADRIIATAERVIYPTTHTDTTTGETITKVVNLTDYKKHPQE